jgi:hypothetical protein
MKPQASSFLMARLILASFVCLLILAIAIPSLGSVSLPNHTIGYGWQDALAVIVIITPLILIFIGAARSQITEQIGWALMIILLVLGFAR